MPHCPDLIKRLIDRFTQQSDHIHSPDYNETLIRIDFINPLMSELGWDIDNHQGFAEQYREVVHEDRVRVAGQTKAPDYSFRVGGARKFFLEAKKPAVDIKNHWEPAYQLRRYAWSAKLACSLLTDFEEFAIYDTRIQPRQLEKASVARRDYILYTEYPDRWDFLTGTFSKDAVLKGDFDRYCESSKGRGAQLFDDAFLAEIETWRKSLASALARHNEALEESALNFAVQRIIDRIIFLRIAEDRGTEPVGQLQALLNGDAVYPRLCKLFRDADARYNSGLFHFEKERDRDETPDTLTPALEVDDRALKNIIRALYYPASPYEFTMVSADILGSVYERFLGKVITLTAGHNAKIEEKPEVRKAGGVYYTPTYIVDYIVKNTVGRLLDSSRVGLGPPSADAGKPGDSRAGLGPPSADAGKPGDSRVGLGPPSADAGKSGGPRPTLRILDPACGSGSFLIGAYQFLLDWYLAQYTASDPQKLATGKNPVLRPALSPQSGTGGPPVGGAAAATSPWPGTPGEGRGGGSSWRLTIAERKRILLDHIHGVDLDSAAVEVTKLNLLLKCLEGETSQTLGFQQRLFRERALPDLGKNILCGNSLIGTDIIGTEAWNAMSEDDRRRINPFDYERAFPQVFKGKDGGFDAVIGNPPYVRMESFVPLKQHLEHTYKCHDERTDLYCYFVEMSLTVLREAGVFGMIISNKWMQSKYGANLRTVVTQNARVEQIIDFGELPVFSAAATFPAIYVFARAKPGAAYRFLFLAPTSTEVFSKVQARTTTLSELVASVAQDLPSNRLGETWNFASETELHVLERLRAGARALDEYTGGRILYGIKTGLLEAFLIDRSTRDRLTRQSARAGEAIKPYVFGDEVRKYRIESTDRYLIYLPRGVSVEGLEPVLKHLEPFRSRLNARATQQEWFELQQAQFAYSLDFAKPKIIYPDIAKASRFAFDAEGRFPADTTFSIPADDKFLLGVLNSKAMWFYFMSVCPVLGDSRRGGRLRLKLNYVKGAPIPQGTPAQIARLTSLVTTMLSLHSRLSAEQLPQRREQLQREIDATDRQIDQLVYQLYALTDDEIRIVEEATK